MDVMEPAFASSITTWTRGARLRLQLHGGEIKAYHGIVNKWLLVVYAILAVFGAPSPGSASPTCWSPRCRPLSWPSC